MANFVPNKPFSAETLNITANILNLHDGPHAFAYSGGQQVLTIRNKEAVTITVNLLGDGVTAHNCPGVGVIDVSAGKDYAVAAGDTITVYTRRISGYLGAAGNNVVVTITGTTTADSAEAWLEEY